MNNPSMNKLGFEFEAIDVTATPEPKSEAEVRMSRELPAALEEQLRSEEPTRSSVLRPRILAIAKTLSDDFNINDMLTHLFYQHGEVYQRGTVTRALRDLADQDLLVTVDLGVYFYPIDPDEVEVIETKCGFCLEQIEGEGVIRRETDFCNLLCARNANKEDSEDSEEAQP